MLAGVLAGLSISSAAAAEMSQERWKRMVGWKLDTVLDDPDRIAPPGWRIGEATLQLAPGGQVTGWSLTRSTGDARDDRTISRAARLIDRLPPPPSSVAGRPVVLRVAFWTPKRIGTEMRTGQPPRLRPDVLLDDPVLAADGGPAPVVITAVR